MISGHLAAVTGTIPGQEVAAFGGVLACGVLLAVVFFYLWVKVGFRPTFGLFTAGLRPRRRKQAQHEETDNEHADKRPPRA
jgi:hypothetical protein